MAFLIIKLKRKNCFYLTLLYRRSSSTTTEGYISSLKEEIRILNEEISTYPCSEESEFEEDICRSQATEVLVYYNHVENDPRPLNHPERVADERRERSRAFAAAKDEETRADASRTEVEKLQLEVRILKEILALRKERHRRF